MKKRLTYKPGKQTITGCSRAFLQFRHKHEGTSELIELILIAIVFVLLFLKHGELSHIIGTIAHLAAGTLLLGKFVFLAAWKISVRYGDIYGVEP